MKLVVGPLGRSSDFATACIVADPSDCISEGVRIGEQCGIATRRAFIAVDCVARVDFQLDLIQSREGYGNRRNNRAIHD